MAKTKQASDEVYKTEKAIEQLEKRDKFGELGKWLLVLIGVLIGKLVSVMVATFFLGSLSVFFFGVPALIVAGCALLGAGGLYLLARMIKSGAQQDQIRKELIEKCKKKLETMRQPASRSDLNNLKSALSDAISQGLISAKDAERMVRLVEAQQMKVDVALVRIQALCQAHTTAK